MKHTILFDNCENHWDNALPFGNGTMGCMTFYEKDKLFMPYTHYEVYYNISEEVLPRDIEKNLPEIVNPGSKHETYIKRADNNIPQEGEPFCYYRTDRDKTKKDLPYGTKDWGWSSPQTGELVFNFSESLKGAESKLCLNLEDAKGNLTLTKDKKTISVETLVSRKDCIVNCITQTEENLLRSVDIVFRNYRDIKTPDVKYKQVDDRTVLYTAKRKFSDSYTFIFSGIVRFIGATVTMAKDTDSSVSVKIDKNEKEFIVLTGIATDWRFDDTEKSAIENMDGYEKELDEMLICHKEYWTEFFNRSSITLPDKFLEKVYFINQYALDCCSGKDGVMKHQACGLNGLWQIRFPGIWNSMWYWDVNIQAAFAGVFSSNRLDLGKVFSDGLRSYMGVSRHWAKEVYNLKGCASDYPFSHYYCCWMWCAQYLWYQYEYSLDKDYLKNEAYPLFLELCEFTAGIFEYDKEKDRYFVYPDISPEQGPLAHNTTITVACAKYLMQFTLKAAEILGDNAPILSKCREILPKMPGYTFSKPGKYGVHFNDSEDAPDNLWLRHPSMLMPVFPIGEFDLSSSKEMQDIISNTVEYLTDNCEIGIFGGSWLAAAAARIGRGQAAIRLLYERGIDHMLRSNGLTAEETDRFVNYCILGRNPLYLPCMMEFSGEMLAAVNEMLMQSQNGIIRIFPAIPDGDKEYFRTIRDGYSIHDFEGYYNEYPAWNDVSFDKLLAKGAFEVSAFLKGGKLSYAKILSKKGGKLSVTSGFFTPDVIVFEDGVKINFFLENGIYSLDTLPGKTYVFATEYPAENVAESSNPDSGISNHFTYTKRTLSIGENSETLYQKKLDYFLRDWYVANNRMENNTIYKINITDKEPDKDEYMDNIPMQYMTNNCGLIMNGAKFRHIGSEEFDYFRGYGFKDASDIKIINRTGPDLVRRDFAESDKEAEFLIEAPRGQYEILLISGDSEEECITIAEVTNSRRIGGKVIPKGTYQCDIIPLIHEDDGIIRIRLSTLPGYKWKLNAIMLNVIKGY